MQEEPPATEPHEIPAERMEVERRNMMKKAYLKLHEEIGREPPIPASRIFGPEGDSLTMKDYMDSMDPELWSRFESLCSEMMKARVEEIRAEEAKNIEK